MKTKFLKHFVLFVVAVTPMLFYVINFFDSRISDNPSDWGDFGSYFGGVYSVIVGVFVVYLANSLTKREERNKKRQEAVELLYEQISKIDTSNIDVKKVNKLYRILDEKKLYLPDNVFNKVRQLGDHYLKIRCGEVKIDVSLENDVKNTLKQIYDD